MLTDRTLQAVKRDIEFRRANPRVTRASVFRIVSRENLSWWSVRHTMYRVRTYMYVYVYIRVYVQGECQFEKVIMNMHCPSLLFDRTTVATTPNRPCSILKKDIAVMGVELLYRSPSPSPRRCVDSRYTCHWQSYTAPNSCNFYYYRIVYSVQSIALHAVRFYLSKRHSSYRNGNYDEDRRTWRESKDLGVRNSEPLKFHITLRNYELCNPKSVKNVGVKKNWPYG